MSNLVFVLFNIRSGHNVGSIFRSADGLGIDKLILTGYTPYPAKLNDTRLPHLQRQQTDKINKTALGAIDSVKWEQTADVYDVIRLLKESGYRVAALEQAPNSTPLSDFKPNSKQAVIVGPEVEGLPKEVLNLCDEIVEIPMRGKKESFNVAVAAAVSMFALTSS